MIIGLLALLGIVATIALLSNPAPTPETPPAETDQMPPSLPVAVEQPVATPNLEPPQPTLVPEAIIAATARGASVGATTREVAVAIAWDATHTDEIGRAHV
jgi:hypothetical protein